MTKKQTYRSCMTNERDDGAHGIFSFSVGMYIKKSQRKVKRHEQYAACALCVNMLHMVRDSHGPEEHMCTSGPCAHGSCRFMFFMIYVCTENQKIPYAYYTPFVGHVITICLLSCHRRFWTVCSDAYRIFWHHIQRRVLFSNRCLFFLPVTESLFLLFSRFLYFWYFLEFFSAALSMRIVVRGTAWKRFSTLEATVVASCLVSALCIALSWRYV